MTSCNPQKKLKAIKELRESENKFIISIRYSVNIVYLWSISFVYHSPHADILLEVLAFVCESGRGCEIK